MTALTNAPANIAPDDPQNQPVRKITVEEFARMPRTKLSELVDGVVVEKNNEPEAALYEWELEVGGSGGVNTFLAMQLGFFIQLYLVNNNIGYVSGADGTYILSPGLTRIPDVGFILKDRLSSPPTSFIPIPPDLAVEVISPSESAGDIVRKVGEYFTAGVGLVWIIFSDVRKVYVYTAEDKVQILNESDTLDGGEVLPGFTLPLRDLFAILNG